MERLFHHTEERLLSAKKETLAFEEDSALSTSFGSVSAAESWVRRVETWLDNIRQDLESDSLPAPGSTGVRWLLYPSGGATTGPSTG
eukprot:6433729-Karenia_brevis.AAC.1